MTIPEKLRRLGYRTVDDAYLEKLDQWRSWYTGSVAGFHRYRVRNGPQTIRCKRYALGMAKKLSEDWAGLLVGERLDITAAGAAERAFLRRTLSDFLRRAGEVQELKFALGAAAYVATATGQRPDGMATGVRIDCVAAGHIWPLSWRGGTVTECAFDSPLRAAGTDYRYLQIHRLDDSGRYVIENHLLRDRDGDFTDVPLEAVLGDSRCPGFERLPEVVHTGSSRRQFVIDRPNIVNNFDPSCPLGLPVFANAIDALEGADIAYDAFVHDFITGKRRLFITPAATAYLDGEPAFDPHDVALYVLPEDVSGENKPIQETGGKFAVSDTAAGVQTALNLLASKCGLGENHYRFDRGGFNQGVVETATQVVSENSALFRTVRKHQAVLRPALEELARIVLGLGNRCLGLDLDEDTAITVSFDDSIIEDTAAERANDRQDLAAGVMKDWEYRVKWYNEDEQTAKSMLTQPTDAEKEVST